MLKILPVKCMFTNTLPARCMFIDTLPSSKVHTSPPAGSAEEAAASSYDADLQKTIEMSLRVSGSQVGIAYPEFRDIANDKNNQLCSRGSQFETFQF